MNRFEQQWQKLTAAARQARDDRGAAAPYGFATRVAALAAALPARAPWAPFERFALRGLMVAATLGVAAVAFNYSAFLSDQLDEYAGNDTVVEMLDLS